MKECSIHTITAAFDVGARESFISRELAISPVTARIPYCYDRLQLKKDCRPGTQTYLQKFFDTI